MQIKTDSQKSFDLFNKKISEIKKIIALNKLIPIIPNLNSWHIQVKITQPGSAENAKRSVLSYFKVFNKLSKTLSSI